MFDMFNYDQGRYIVFAIILIAIGCYQSHYLNNQLEKYHDENMHDSRRRQFENAPVFFPVLAIVLLLVALLSPLSVSRSSEELTLEEKYDELVIKHEELKDSIESAYGDAICIKGYFLGWEEAPKKDAEAAIKNLYDKLYPGEW